MPFVTRDVRVPVQENIDIIRRSIGWNVLKANFQSAPHKIENQGPLEIAIAISADNRDARPDSPQFVQNRFCTNIAKVPDLISVLWPSSSRSPADDCACPREQTRAAFRIFRP